MPTATSATSAVSAASNYAIDFGTADVGYIYTAVALQTSDTNTALMINQAEGMQSRNKQINELRMLKTRLQACNPNNKTGTDFEPLSSLPTGVYDPTLYTAEWGKADTLFYDSLKLKNDLTAAGFVAKDGGTRGPGDGHSADATFDQMNDWLSQISNQIDSLTSTTSTDSIYLQQFLNKSTNAMEQGSNVQKKVYDTKSSITRNIGA